MATANLDDCPFTKDNNPINHVNERVFTNDAMFPVSLQRNNHDIWRNNTVNSSDVLIYKHIACFYGIG